MNKTSNILRKLLENKLIRLAILIVLTVSACGGAPSAPEGPYVRLTSQIEMPNGSAPVSVGPAKFDAFFPIATNEANDPVRCQVTDLEGYAEAMAGFEDVVADMNEVIANEFRGLSPFSFYGLWDKTIKPKNLGNCENSIEMVYTIGITDATPHEGISIVSVIHDAETSEDVVNFTYTEGADLIGFRMFASDFLDMVKDGGKGKYQFNFETDRLIAYEPAPVGLAEDLITFTVTDDMTGRGRLALIVAIVGQYAVDDKHVIKVFVIDTGPTLNGVVRLVDRPAPPTATPHPTSTAYPVTPGP